MNNFVTLILGIAGWIFYACAFHAGWGYFITTEFGIDAPSKGVCLGIVCLAGLLTNRVRIADLASLSLVDAKDRTYAAFVVIFVNNVLIPLSSWFFMWIIFKLFV